MNHFYSNLKLFLVALLACVGVSAWGEETVYQTALFGKDYNSKGVSSYTDTWTSTTEGFAVSLVNFNNNNNGWNLVKCGRKNNASIATITTVDAIDQAITKVDVTIDALTAAKVNSIKLFTSSDNSTWTEAGSYSAEVGAQSVVLSSPVVDQYYKIEFDCASGSSNGLVTVSKVEFYYEASSSDSRAATEVVLTEGYATSGEVGSTVDLPTATVYAGETSVDGATVTWTSSNEEVANIDGTTVQLLAVGTVTIKATYAGDATTYQPSSKSYTLTVNPALSTIAEAQDKEAGTTVCVEGVIVASAANGAVLYDDTDYLYYYNTSNALTVGQKVRMVGALASYGGAKQLTNSATVTVLGTEEVTHPAAVELDGAAFDAIKTAEVATRKYVTFEGELAISGNYYNVTIEGATEAVGSIVKPSEDLSALDGKKVVVTGYLMYVSGKYVYVVATDVEEYVFNPTSVITNADFSSTEGWTPVVSGQFRDYGNGLIGDYTVRFSPATVDETHLNTEYCLGVECRWSTNYASFTQTTAELPAGAYALSFDVENVNGATKAAAYENRFSVTVGETVFSDESTEWMQGQSAWTTHTIPFLLNEDGSVTISLGYGNGANNISADNTPALYISHLKLTAITLEDYWKGALEKEMAAAKEVDVTTNVGTAAFQRPESLATALTAAITAAEGVHNDTEATADAISAAVKNLQEAGTAFAGAELNAPADGQLFNIVNVSEGYNHASKAVTFKSAADADLAANTTAMGWTELPGSIYPQAVKFTAVEGEKNVYTLSYTRADGNTIYVSTGITSGLGDATTQIRPTTDAAKALKVRVEASATDGTWYLWNTEAGKRLGANGASDQGFFTGEVNGYKFYDMKLQEAVKNEVALSIKAADQYGTIIVPFSTEIPDGMKAYSVSEVDGTTLTLVEAGAIAANTPYIVFAEAGIETTLAGVGASFTQLSYTEGLLTGTYEDITAEAGKYVLQNQEGKGVAFYLVDAVTPAVKANHAYLTAPSAGVKAFYLGEVATAIEKVMAGAAAGEIYDLTGRKVSRMVKGNAYIVGGRKVVIK